MFKTINLVLVISLIEIVLCGHKNCDDDIPDEPKPKECCYLPTIIPRNIRADCLKNVGADVSTAIGNGNKNLTAELKVAQCIFEKANAIEGDSINVRRVEEVGKSELSQHSHISEEFEESLEKCNDKEHEMLNDFHRKVKEHNFVYDKGVNPVYALYISCIGTRLIGDCPDDYEIDTKSCEKARDYLDDCHYQYPYPLYINFNKI